MHQEAGRLYPADRLVLGNASAVCAGSSRYQTCSELASVGIALVLQVSRMPWRSATAARFGSSTEMCCSRNSSAAVHSLRNRLTGMFHAGRTCTAGLCLLDPEN
jgi:hypothetical protein